MGVRPIVGGPLPGGACLVPNAAPSEREGKRGGGMMNGSSLLQVRLCETEQISRDVCPVFLLFFFVSKFSFSHVSRAVYVYVQYVAKYCVPFALIITL